MSSLNPHKYDIPKIAKNFDIYGEFIEFVPFGSGHINDTYAASYVQGGAVIRYIHQRVNHAVFKASLFMAAGIVDHETGQRDMRLLSGLRRAMPVLMASGHSTETFTFGT